MNMKFVKPLLTLLLRLALAVAVAAIVLAGACIMMEGDLEEVMTAFFLGPIEDEYAIAEILREMVPLIFTGVAVSLMVRCGSSTCSWRERSLAARSWRACWPPYWASISSLPP